MTSLLFAMRRALVRRSGKTLSLAALAVLTAVFGGCMDAPSSIPHGNASPGAAAFTIRDAAHGGNAHFYWLPPMVAAPSPTGTFDATISPVVSICQATSSGCSGDPFVTFTMAGDGAAAIRVDPTSGQYIVNWDTGLSGVAVGATCRISVSVAGAIVGVADVTLISNGSARNQLSGDVIALVDGRTLPIKFRVEQGMVVSVAVAPNPATVILGKTTALTATLTDAHGTAITDQPITWASTPSATAAVDGSGVVTGVAIGSATVTASSNGVSGSAQVNVIPPPVASVVVTPAAATIIAGNTVAFTAALKDADGDVLTDRVVSWTSSDPTIATVDPTGVVKAVAAGGPVTIAATSEGKSGSAQVTVKSAAFTLASVAAGDGHTCGVAPNGSAYCWGLNAYGQLGNGTSSGHSAVPVAVAGGLAFRQITAGGLTTCGLVADGTAYCWGFGGQGALGTGTFVNQSAPTPVRTSVRFAQLAAGGNSTCGLATDGSAWCWGGNSNGLLGAGPNYTGDGSVPVAVVGGHTFVAIANGLNMTCGITASGETWCWGLLYDSTPVQAQIGHSLAAISIGQFTLCGLDGSGSAWCWGSNADGEYGNGIATGPIGFQRTASQAAGGRTLTSIQVSINSVCGRTPSGDVYCWGQNGDGQLGNGNNVAQLTPAIVAGNHSFASIAGANRTWACGIAVDQSVYCWGLNEVGQLGDGTTVSRNVPTQVVLPAGGTP